MNRTFWIKSGDLDQAVIGGKQMGQIEPLVSILPEKVTGYNQTAATQKDDHDCNDYPGGCITLARRH